jgi:DNA topoisomerase-1
MTKLVIVESPGKIKKIKSFLGPEYIVMASVGHIRGLAFGSNSVDPNNNFEPTYEILPDKKKIITGLKKCAKNVNEIFIASDGDREGEAIAYHLVSVLDLTLDEYNRIVFNEITKNAIIKAIQEPRKIDMNMFNAQQARCILDWLIGFKVSPILRLIPNVISRSLGAGRVQSVVTRLIVEKEKEIEYFLNSDKDSMYNISGDFTINGYDFKGKYIYHSLVTEKLHFDAVKPYFDSFKFDSYKIIKSNVDSKDLVKIIMIDIRNNPIFTILESSCTDRLRYPPPPFTTSTLQQESSYKLHVSLKQTMRLAQTLYEKGLITYMRTDSPTLSNEALNNIRKCIMNEQQLGENYYQFRQFKAKNGNAQEAHEAIRPTHFDITSLTDYNLLGTNEEKLYILIWNRSVASQMKPAKYQDQHIVLSNSTNEQFEGTNSVLIFDGYLKLYRENQDNDEIETSHIKFNVINLKLNDVAWSKIYFTETYNSPPMRYNEPSLVKKLEKLGIGRPSTYAYIITKIQEHKYVCFSDSQGIEKLVDKYTLTYIDNSTPAIITKKSHIQKIGNDRTKLKPTHDGILITEYLMNNFTQIMDYQFTAHMENLLDEIASGNKIWYNVLKEYYTILRDQFNKLNFDIDKSYYKPQSIDETKTSDIIRQDNMMQVIGKHPKYGEIIYMNAKFGPVFKVKLSSRSKNKKVLFVNAGKLKVTDPNILNSAIQFIDYKVKKLKELKPKKK